VAFPSWKSTENLVRFSKTEEEKEEFGLDLEYVDPGSVLLNFLLGRKYYFPQLQVTLRKDFMIYRKVKLE
jgi:hypothetical protein